jgi:uncharacterized protein (TIGR02246 family)
LTTNTVRVENSQEAGEAEIRALHRQLIDAWNNRNPGEFAALFAEDGNSIGFDGSQLDGRAAIENEIRRIFTDHQTATYYPKVREVRFLTPDAAILRAVVGMVPPGKSDINPATNAIQSLVAARQGSQWRIALFQNTPAQFHGRPELAEALTRELQELL